MDTVQLKIIGPSVSDRRPIGEAFRRFGTDWPKVDIEWPNSADEILNVLDRALDQFDKGASKLLGAEVFAENVNKYLSKIPELRSMAERGIPSMVRRLRLFQEEERENSVSNFLLYANWEIHRMPHYYATAWLGMRELGLEAPSSWETLRIERIDLLTEHERVLANVLGYPGTELANTLLIRLDGMEMNMYNGSPGVYVFLPRRNAEAEVSFVQAAPGSLTRSDFCQWVVPQLEYDLLMGNIRELPDAYGGLWSFYKISGT
jgi:hypothetical protein